MNLAVPHVVRNYQMQQAIAYGFTPLEQLPARDDVLSIVGYGPSILSTWRQISGPVLSLSGAHDFLIKLGIVPKWHADCDPRVHKASFVKHPHRFTTYVMASCCHPLTWEQLLTNMVRIWHADNGPETQAWLAEHQPRGAVLRPGPSIGTASLVLARILGFRRARCFGFDSCLVDGELRAGGSEAPYTDERPQVVDVAGVPYLTTENMKRQAEAFTEFAAGLEVELVGDGLLKAMLNQPKEGHMATKGVAPKKKPAAPKPAAAALDVGARVNYVKPDGTRHGGAIAVLHADGKADVALDNGRDVLGAPRAQKAGEAGAWSPA